MKRALLFFVALALASCSKSEPEPTKPDPSPAASSAAPPGAASTTAEGVPMVLARGVKLVKAAPGGDVVSSIRDEQAKAKADGRDLVVYVGATWCEPCQYFHKAAAHGDLDGAFPDLTLLEFDYDDAKEPLTAAGYVGNLVPLFAVPGPDGKAIPDRHIEGSIKGPGAVGNITPRLKKLLGK